MSKLSKVGQLKRLCQHAAQLRWSNAPHQGRSRQPQYHPSSHSWIRTDDLYPAAYKFAIKARLDLHPTNANKQLWGQQPDGNCRRCGQREDIHHILSFCSAYMPHKTRRHDTILNRIAKSVRYNNRNHQVFINQSPPHIIANGLRPDIVVIHEKEVIMLDVVVTSQHQPDALHIARRRKQDKYSNLALQYQLKGFQVTNDAIAFGDVGHNDWRNYTLLRKLGTPRNAAIRLMKWCVNDTLRSGHHMWIARCTANHS
jgi:hypothetical protein